MTKKAVDKMLGELRQKEQVCIGGFCIDTIVYPKENRIQYVEKDRCEISLKTENPIVERAKAKLLKEVYKNSSGRLQLVEQIKATKEEE